MYYVYKKLPNQKIVIDDSDNTVMFQNFDIGDNWNINLRDASTNTLVYQFSGTIGEGDTKQRGNDWNVWFSCVSQGDLNHGTLRHIMPGTYIVNADGTNSYGKLISSSPSTITVLASDDKGTCAEPIFPPPPVPELNTMILVSAGLLGMLLVLRGSN
ncbi:MAG: hypothetical protein KKG76_06970 [Euryarchaeota archaeon]|nr:hypothetical protein [Euryarchaeota archaeon]